MSEISNKGIVSRNYWCIRTDEVSSTDIRHVACNVDRSCANSRNLALHDIEHLLRAVRADRGRWDVRRKCSIEKRAKERHELVERERTAGGVLDVGERFRETDLVVIARTACPTIRSMSNSTLARELPYTHSVRHAASRKAGDRKSVV